MIKFLGYLFSICLIIMSICITNKYHIFASKEEKQQAGAYLAVFQEFYPPNRIPLLTTRDRKTFYISVDLSNVHYKYPDLIKAEIEKYLRGSGFILLWDDMNALIESGLILTENGRPCFFENGELFCCKDKSLTETLLETEAYAWAGNVGGFGATYKVEKNADEWKIISITDNWIS